MIGLMHGVALIAGLVVLFLIRKKYPGISSVELGIIIGLYVILVLLFTDPVVNFLKKLVT